MDPFPDRAYVRLRSSAHGLYLYADEDGVGVSLSSRRESPNTAWRVRRLQLGDDDHVCLLAAAYGRYLAVSPNSAPRGGRRVVQSAYESPGQDDILWEAVVVGDRIVRMRHVSEYFLRANGRYRGRWYSSVSVDYVNNQSTMTHWKVEAIPPRLAPSELPPPNPFGAPGMELLPDRSHVRLKSGSHGCGLFLNADEDGWGISLAARRASLNTAWQVHRVRRDGNNYVLLISSAYGRYLTLWSQPASRSYRLTQGVYVSSGQKDVLWEAVSTGTAGKILLRHGDHTCYYLNAVADPGAGRMCKLWTVETIPRRPEPPVLSPPTLTPAGTGGFRRRILYMRIDYSGDYVPNSFGTFEFQGRSSYDLRGTLAKLLNKEICSNITLCICPGSKGRLTPLVVDLPANEEPIAIAVLITGSPAENCAVSSVFCSALVMLLFMEGLHL